MKMILLHIMFYSLLFSCDTSHKKDEMIVYEQYVILKPTENNVEATAYFYSHLKKRTTEGVVLLQGKDAISKSKSKVQFIDVSLDSELKTDYEILKKDNNLTLKAKNKKTLYWLFYQFFQNLSSYDSKINGKDLPPAFVSFNDSKKGNFAFEYREPHLQANLAKDYDVIINTNNVENDWGIWGHQLFKLLNKKPNNAYYSIVNGTLNKNQICFSNPITYSFLEKYIINNFGESIKSKQNFVISPADNELVCTCSKCASQGNTNGNASYSVVALVNKLAIRFPNHHFFVLDYISVKTPPKSIMPSNTGVIISTINLPRKVNLDLNNVAIREFESKVKNWNKVCSNIYVWDYISNFDDYLTPFPTLSVCKSNFNFYKKLKITGVFANGAGYDYSTFNEVHTYVLAALMQDPNLDIKTLITRFCEFYYGDSGQVIADYILEQENLMQTNNYNLELYSGIKNLTKTYLNESIFFNFYQKIDEIKNKGNEDEVVRLNQLYTGLTFSAMQIEIENKFDKEFGFLNVNNENVKVKDRFVNQYSFFSEKFKKNNILTIRERDGNTENYLNDVKTSLLDTKFNHNLLNKNILKIKSALDEDYTDSSVLTDGIPGLITDFHNAWLIVSANDLVTEFITPNGAGNYNLKISFLLDDNLKMKTPSKIEVIINSKINNTIVPSSKNTTAPERLSVLTKFTLANNDKVEIKIYRGTTIKKFACDEIFLYK